MGTKCSCLTEENDFSLVLRQNKDLIPSKIKTNYLFLNK